MVQKNVPLLFKVTERCGGKERTRPQGSQNFDDCSFNNLALSGISYYSRWHGQKRFLKTINNICTISVAYCLLLLIWLIPRNCSVSQASVTGVYLSPPANFLDLSGITSCLSKNYKFPSLGVAFLKTSPPLH